MFEPRFKSGCGMEIWCELGAGVVFDTPMTGVGLAAGAYAPYTFAILSLFDWLVKAVEPEVK